MALPDLIRKVNVALGKEALQRLDDMLTTDEFNELQACSLGVALECMQTT